MKPQIELLFKYHDLIYCWTCDIKNKIMHTRMSRNQLRIDTSKNYRALHYICIVIER